MATSDIDLMVVTDSLGPSDLLERLGEVEARLRRRIGLQVYGKREFEKLAREGHHFVAKVLSRPKMMIIGDEDALERMAPSQPQES